MNVTPRQAEADKRPTALGLLTEMALSINKQTEKKQKQMEVAAAGVAAQQTAIAAMQAAMTTLLSSMNDLNRTLAGKFATDKIGSEPVSQNVVL